MLFFSKEDFLTLENVFSANSKTFPWSYEESEIISDFESGSEDTISFWIFRFGSRKTKFAQNFAPQWIVFPKFCRGSLQKFLKNANHVRQGVTFLWFISEIEWKKTPNEPRQNFANTNHCGSKFWANFVFRLPNLEIQNEIVFSDPNSKSEMMPDSSCD